MSPRWAANRRPCAELSPNCFTSGRAFLVVRLRFHIGSPTTFPMSASSCRKSPAGVWILDAIRCSSNTSMMSASMSFLIITAQASYHPCSYDPFSWWVILSRYPRVSRTTESGRTLSVGEAAPVSGGLRSSRVSCARALSNTRPALATSALSSLIVATIQVLRHAREDQVDLFWGGACIDSNLDIEAHLGHLEPRYLVRETIRLWAVGLLVLGRN